MDFSYFTSAPQPYSFFGLHDTSSNDHTNQFDNYQGHITADQYNAAFAAFQQNFQYDHNTFLPQPDDSSQPQSPIRPQGSRHDSLLSLPEVDQMNLQPPAHDLTPDESLTNAAAATTRSSSEEKDTLTPQQSRRKAQNRAAQRAFRERKEKHVKDLEAKLTSLQHQSVSLNGENERLRREIAKIATENEILRATSGSQNNGPTPFLEEPDELVGPLGYIPIDMPSKKNGANLSSKYAHYGTLTMLTVDDETGEPLLGTGATWDYIQAHELFRKGLVDVGDVCERLKKLARCDGQGPVFQESDVRQAIVDSAVAGGRDELI